jgi:two-component system CheB/CheR fusion protein
MASSNRDNRGSEEIPDAVANDVSARLAAIVESTEDAVYSKTLDGTIRSWNQGAVRLFGYSAREAIGAPITLIVPPEERWAEEDILVRIRRGERVGNYETVRVAKDGQRIDVSLTVSPVVTDDGRMIGASSIARDITDRKRQERGLRTILEMSGRLASKLDRQTILDDIAQTLAVIQGAEGALVALVAGEDGTLRPAAHYRVPDQLLKALQRVMPGAGACGRCLATGQPVYIEDVSADAGFEPFLDAARQAGVRTVSSLPLTDTDGTVFGVVSTYFRHPPSAPRHNTALADLAIQLGIDFLERAHLYSELQETDRSKNRFLAILSHELRNPLAPIRSAIETVHLIASGSPELAGPLSVIDRQITQMARLIDDLLDISRITNNKLNLRREPVDLADVVRAAIEASRPILGSSDHELRVVLPDQPIWINADPTRIAQVIGNLLNNAAKYTPESGQIHLTVELADEMAVIRVRDNGVGIPSGMLSRVFEMFTQVEDAKGRAKGGLGIGLTLAQRLVELHGGTITAASEGSGQGSEFTIRLPVVPAPPPDSAAAARPVARLEVQRTSHPLRIMIVDDNRDAADSLGALLSLHGHEVRIAYDSLDAIESAGGFHPQVMLLDIGLPGLNGYETAQQVRQQPWGRNLLLIAVTGWGQEEAKRRSWEAGFDSHLVKPVDPTVLVELLGTLQSARE